MTTTQNDTSTAIEVGDILVVIDNSGDSLGLRNNEIVLARAVDDKYEGFEQLVSVAKADGGTGHMYAFRFHKLAVGDRVKVDYSGWTGRDSVSEWDGVGTVARVQHGIDDARSWAVSVTKDDGAFAGETGSFPLAALTFIETAEEYAAKQEEPLAAWEIELLVTGFIPGDRVVYVGNTDGEYFEPEVVGATGTVTQQYSDTTSVSWDYDSTRQPSVNVFTANLALASELVAKADEELDAIPTVADLEGFAAINNEGTVLRSVETGYVYGKQGGRWLQLGSTGDASWTVVKAVEVGKHMQVLTAN